MDNLFKTFNTVSVDVNLSVATKNVNFPNSSDFELDFSKILKFKIGSIIDPRFRLK